MVYILNSTSVQVDPLGFHYIQLKKGDRLSLECNSYLSTSIILPGNQYTKSLHYDKYVDVEDTGAYACKCPRSFLCAEPKVYVYVHDENGTGFLPLTSQYEPIQMPFIPDTNIDIPCRPTIHSTKQDMELLVDNATIPECNTEFDPRKGFRVPVSGIEVFNYTCRHKHKSGVSQTILVEIFDRSQQQGVLHRAKGSRDAFFFIRVRDGDGLVISCNSKLFATYVTFPNETMHISSMLVIRHVQITDAGVYKCSCSMFICGEPRIRVIVLVVKDEGFLPAERYIWQQPSTAPELIIPCRTRENTTKWDVELKIENIKLPAAELNYDPRIGFQFPFPHLGTYNFTCTWQNTYQQNFVVTVEDEKISNKKRRAIRPDSIGTVYAQFEAETIKMAGRTERALPTTEMPGKDYAILSEIEITNINQAQFNEVPLDDETARAAWFRLIIFAVVLTLIAAIIVIVISKYAICVCQILRKRKRLHDANDASIELMQIREERTA
ncbi:hypothetical protein WR25_01919 [Diploscapter pachys]|uniref:Ig-like domain-containing protein n=1 Tax=Diploscapter pachys TaxID=2018661 RepID=A0A2A2JSL7_9BILA|nr:hypothetical protein WR25_01919 [Diploscapter pachys]